MQFDWPIAFWPITWESVICLIWDWWWNINDNIGFHFRLFPGKSNKIFQIQITLFWGHFGPFLPKFEQKWIFLERSALPVEKLPANKENLMINSWEKCHTDGQRDRLVSQNLPLEGGPVFCFALLLSISIDKPPFWHLFFFQS